MTMTMTRDKVVLFRNNHSHSHGHSHSHCHCFLLKKSNAYRITTMKIPYQLKSHYTSSLAGAMRKNLDCRQADFYN